VVYTTVVVVATYLVTEISTRAGAQLLGILLYLLSGLFLWRAFPTYRRLAAVTALLTLVWCVIWFTAFTESRSNL
jgi:hypothetical protein